MREAPAKQHLRVRETFLDRVPDGPAVIAHQLDAAPSLERRVQAKATGVWVPNEVIADYVAQHPDKLIGWASVDPGDPDAIWITEVWESKDHHAASLQLPQVRATIAKAKPIIAGFGPSTVVEVKGGVGLR